MDSSIKPLLCSLCLLFILFLPSLKKLINAWPPLCPFVWPKLLLTHEVPFKTISQVRLNIYVACTSRGCLNSEIILSETVLMYAKFHSWNFCHAFGLLLPVYSEIYMQGIHLFNKLWLVGLVSCYIVCGNNINTFLQMLNVFFCS